jgi:hypothetical protein
VFKQAAPDQPACGGVDWSKWPEFDERFAAWAAIRLAAQVNRGADGLKI